MRLLPMMTLTLALAMTLTSACSQAPKTATESAGGSTPPPSAAQGPRTVCTQQSDTRFLEVRSRTDGGCELLYTKFGNEKSVASGGKAYCQKVSDQIKTQLTRSGFSCE